MSSLGSVACTATTGLAPNRQFAISWSNWSDYATRTASMNITVVLNESTGAIDLMYGAMSGPSATGASATIGVENGTSSSTQASCNTAAVAPNTAMRFTPM
jgi:hypothetical protein